MQSIETNLLAAAKGTGCLLDVPESGADDPGSYLDASVPPQSGANDPGPRPVDSPRQERVRHLLYGSLAGLDRTIKILHALGYANPNDWSEPIPTGKPHQWMVIMTKLLLL